VRGADGNSYIDDATALNNKLISTDGGVAKILVDSTTPLTVGGVGRDSVRISTIQPFTHGLIVGDISHMPGGACGTWPACELD